MARSLSRQSGGKDEAFPMNLTRISGLSRLRRPDKFCQHGRIRCESNQESSEALDPLCRYTSEENTRETGVGPVVNVDGLTKCNRRPDWRKGDGDEDKDRDRPLPIRRSHYVTASELVFTIGLEWHHVSEASTD